MKSIELTQGKVAIVDDDDFDWLSQFNWCAYKGRNTFYVVRHCRLPSGKRTTQKIHRAILERHGHKIDGLEVDHRNHNGLDNRKDNLRAGTTAQNMGNMTHHDDNYIGVRLDRGKYWRSQLVVKGTLLYSATFDTAIEAAIAHDQYIIDHNMSGYPLNFPEVFETSQL